MISQRDLQTLVERVLGRISEATPAPATATDSTKQPKRYRADGTSADDVSAPVSPTAKTQMPPTMHPPTVPAAASSDEAEMNAKLGGMNTRNPKAAPPSQKSIKVNAIKKALDGIGYTADPLNAKYVTQNLNTWYDGLDPADALVSTAEQLAKRFASGD